VATRLHRNWPEYLIEAFCLGAFMLSAAAFTTALDAEVSPLRAWLPDPDLRRALVGLAMGATAVALIYSPWGRRSGAHMNPAVTLTYLGLGRMHPVDALAYVMAQFAGGVAGVWLAAALLGAPFTQPPVNWVVTQPGPRGTVAAFLAETAISGLLMFTVLRVAASRRFAAWTGVCAGLLVAIFITFEAPLSGMSMNPARSVASALPGGTWNAWWLYVLAPILGMALGAALHSTGLQPAPCAKLIHRDDEPCIHCGQRPARSAAP
jgi:aquaporin Z